MDDVRPERSEHAPKLHRRQRICRLEQRAKTRRCPGAGVISQALTHNFARVAREEPNVVSTLTQCGPQIQEQDFGSALRDSVIVNEQDFHCDFASIKRFIGC